MPRLMQQVRYAATSGRMGGRLLIELQSLAELGIDREIGGNGGGQRREGVMDILTRRK